MFLRKERIGYEFMRERETIFCFWQLYVLKRIPSFLSGEDMSPIASNSYFTTLTRKSVSEQWDQQASRNKPRNRERKKKKGERTRGRKTLRAFEFLIPDISNATYTADLNRVC